MESPNSSAFSVTSAPSVISDIDDIGAHAENGNSDGRDSSDCALLALDKVYVIPEHNGKSLFEPGDGDAKIEINGTRFEVHKYLLKRFTSLKSEINGQTSEVLLTIRGVDCIVEDFRNTFKVLYATVLEGPFDFDKSILVSALRTATTYGYPALRTYAISRLEAAKLTAIERIKIAREFGLATWEEPAYIELCERDEPISREEAKILGMDTFVLVAEIREQEQRRRGKEVDARQDNKNTDRRDNKSAQTSPPLGACPAQLSVYSVPHPRHHLLLGGPKDPSRRLPPIAPPAPTPSLSSVPPPAPPAPAPLPFAAPPLPHNSTSALSASSAVPSDHSHVHEAVRRVMIILQE